MELFYFKAETPLKIGDNITLNAAESTHCINVLRHVEGDIINVIDGCGNLLKCKIVETGVAALKKLKKKTKSNCSGVLLSVERINRGFGTLKYNLTMAVAPTKNMERYEWFTEKAVEIGLDAIVPVIGDYSERKSVNEERLNKIVVSAVKQSLKGVVPHISETISVKQFCKECEADIKIICYCGSEVERKYIENVLAEKLSAYFKCPTKPSIAVLIGPEGDFSKEEISQATDNGFIAVHLGSSRLRTETAALVATVIVESMFEE